MDTITPPIDRVQIRTQIHTQRTQPRSEASSYGGVLLLAKAWAALGGSNRLMEGIRWQGQAGPLLLFVLVALPVVSAKSVLAVAATCAKGSDPLMAVLGWASLVTQRRLARFVDSPRHRWIGALGAMIGALASHPATALGQDGIIAVDSTTVEKRYGPKLPEIRPVYDSTQRRLVDGYEVVSACLVDERATRPAGLLPHRKAATAAERQAQKRRRRKAREGELPSKLDLALQLVLTAIGAGVGAPTLVGDSAFAAMWFLGEIARLQLHWLVSTRADRRLRIGAEIRAFRQWNEGLALTLMEAEEGESALYGGLLPQATLLERHRQRKGLSCRAAYFERHNRHGRVIHRWYLVTSHLDWGLEAIWLHWSWRWKIEQLHRDSKQYMSLANFHVRSWQGIVALVACTSLRASLLYFLQAADPICAELSIEGLVPAIREAACSVEIPADGSRGRASIPPSLPALALWQCDQPPLPTQFWPIAFKAAQIAA
jgi:hypothetical protein